MHQCITYRLLVKNGLVSLDPRMKTFTVIGSKGKPNAVTLHPEESCTCPSKSECYHLLAVKISIGMEIDKREKVNLTQLRWNARCKRQGKSGRKRPLPCTQNSN